MVHFAHQFPSGLSVEAHSLAVQFCAEHGLQDDLVWAPGRLQFSHGQWEFQDPKMEVLYHFFGHILGVYHGISPYMP